MKKSFQALNIKCNSCATTVKNRLSKTFGEIEIDLEKMPRVVTLEIKDSDSEKVFRKEMINLGYPLADENIGIIQQTGLKAKSFVSCSVGKFSL